MMSNSRITSIGTYVPKQILTNADLEKMVDTNNEWIMQRSGILERRIAEKDEFTSDLCIAAIKDLINRYGKNVNDVDFIIVCSTTPDFPFPTVSCLFQKKFNIESAGAMLFFQLIYFIMSASFRIDDIFPAGTISTIQEVLFSFMAPFSQ